MAAQHTEPNLFIDGYIAYMFGPKDAEGYHICLLGRERQFINWYTGGLWSLPIFFAAPPHGPGPNQHDWAIDYVAKNTGPVIPQQIWSPRNQSDAQRYVHHEQLRPPIFFVQKNCGRLGLPLIEAAAGNCMSLQDADQLAPVGSSAHAQIRINWRGYAQWNDQIMIRKQTPAQQTISLSTLAKYVAGRVMKFMEKAKRDPYDYSDRRWFIGDSGITPRVVALVGVVHVSQGSWMPILQLNDGFARCAGWDYEVDQNNVF